MQTGSGISCRVCADFVSRIAGFGITLELAADCVAEDAPTGNPFYSRRLHHLQAIARECQSLTDNFERHLAGHGASRLRRVCS